MTDFTPVPTWLGPGLTVNYQAATAGPPAPGDFVTVELWGVSNEEVLWNVEINDPQKITVGSVIIGLEADLQGIQWNLSNQRTKQGDQVRLLYRWRNASGQVIEQDERTLPLDTTVGMPRLMRDLQSSAGAQGGFTAQDRANAQITQMGVKMDLPGLAQFEEVASGLTGFFTNPPSWAMQLLETITISGSGSLVRRGAGREVNAYGCQIDFQQLPLSIGAYAGNPMVFVERIVQLAVVDQGLGNREFYRDTAELYFDHQRFMWGTPFPIRIDYYVLPGCTATLTWLHLAPAWWPF